MFAVTRYTNSSFVRAEVLHPSLDPVQDTGPKVAAFSATSKEPFRF